MAEPQSNVQRLIARVAGKGAGRSAKTLIVSSPDALKEMIQDVAYLGLHKYVDLFEVSDADMAGAAVLPVEPQYHAILIAAKPPSAMLKVRRLCSAYQQSGVPVVAISGWPAPVDHREFKRLVSYSGNINVPGMFDLAARYCRNGVNGDFLEFGTFQGFTLQCAYHAFSASRPEQRFIAFDSFEGIIGTRDDEGFADGAFSASEASFRFANELADVPEGRVVVVAGPYSDTLGVRLNETRALLEPLRAAVVHIDCDVEAPAKLALDFVTPYLMQGSLLIFDEYDMHRADNTKGERSALRAWLAENRSFSVEPYRAYHLHGRSFIVHIN